MRLMLDTCVIIDLLTDVDSISSGALDMLSDRNNQLFASAESMRELVTLHAKRCGELITLHIKHCGELVALHTNYRGIIYTC